jgi:hypothetical protein
VEIKQVYRLVRGRIPEAVRHSDHVCTEVVRHDFGHCPKPSGSQYAWRTYREPGRAGNHSEDKTEEQYIRRINCARTSEKEALVQLQGTGEPKPDSPFALGMMLAQVNWKSCNGR